ncbi:hypothetical protein P872_05545 [Rhodonellum psychrophilum GCM71 = DSM 17998]|uniref:Uncharacterized protein n=1 Tax=Rhodonellum psychrophilum GCM71 = DSM 17998 TaxID=1123057 RepID=U5C1X5_9BACT|nr:hypothetical protein P872_05545 [Rhodonellum psychrophilum GCM71 = DSM 17998]
MGAFDHRDKIHSLTNSQAGDPGFAVRRSHGVGRGKLIDTQNSFTRLTQLPKRRGAQSPQANHGDIKWFALHFERLFFQKGTKIEKIRCGTIGFRHVGWSKMLPVLTSRHEKRENAFVGRFFKPMEFGNQLILGLFF